MTKVRHPLTVELALTRIAGLITWEAVAEIAAQAPRTLRKWSDPDEGPKAAEQISLDLATRLDVAYRKAGGEGSPLLQCLSTRIELDLLGACVDCTAIARTAARAVKESGEAISAAIKASLPGATDADRGIAERQLEESIAAQTEALAAVRRRAAGAVDHG